MSGTVETAFTGSAIAGGLDARTPTQVGPAGVGAPYRASPERKDTDRLMHIMPPRADNAPPVSLEASFADAMARATGCPNAACDNTQPPRCAVPTDAGWMASYLCADCGTAWTTEWSD